MNQQRPARAKTVSERRRQPTEVRRRLIVEAARAVIAERGPFATTLRDIAQASEVSLGTVTYHFSGIAEILAHVLQEEMDSFYLPIADAARAERDPATAMRVLIDGFFADDERTVQHWRLWLDFWGLSAHDQTHARWQEKAYEVWRTDVRRVLEDGIRSGEFSVESPDLVLTDFLISFDGLAVQAYLPGSSMGPAQARDYLHGWVDRRLVGGDRPKPAPGRTSQPSTRTRKAAH